MAKKKISKNTTFWLLTIIITLGLWYFQNVVSLLNKILPFMNQVYFFLLCLGTAMYLADRLK